MAIPQSLDSDPRYKGRLVEIAEPEDVPEHWKGTPIEEFILSENFRRPIRPDDTPKLLLVTCMEFRYALPIPSMYAYVIRRASGRLVGSEFSVGYVLSRGVRHIVLIGHNDCGMTQIPLHKANMIDALVDEGWNRDRAEEYVTYHAARHAIDDEIDALEREYFRLKRLFKRVRIAPLFVCLSNTKLYLPKWYVTYIEEGRKSPVHDAETMIPDCDLLELI